MTARFGTALLGVFTVFAGCSNGDTASFETAALDTNDQKASYGIGLNIGGQLADARDRLDRAAFMRGIEDALQGGEPDVPSQELQAALQTFVPSMWSPRGMGRSSSSRRRMRPR